MPARSRRFTREFAARAFIAMPSERVWRDARDQNVLVSCFSEYILIAPSVTPTVFRIHVAMGRAAAAGRKQN
jgi:hypothetical protein